MLSQVRVLRTLEDLQDSRISGFQEFRIPGTRRKDRFSVRSTRTYDSTT
ncbi:MAG: hypothetical protein IPJ30_14775 [Acidobacteria bacterium]|nr:hypothetical protein [Acidobacteriota bacterium]